MLTSSCWLHTGTFDWSSGDRDRSVSHALIGQKECGKVSVDAVNGRSRVKVQMRVKNLPVVSVREEVGQRKETPKWIIKSALVNNFYKCKPKERRHHSALDPAVSLSEWVGSKKKDNEVLCVSLLSCDIIAANQSNVSQQHQTIS